MDSLLALICDQNSIGHIVVTYAIVIALGTVLGRVKVMGVSLGVTCVLFVALLLNYLGVAINGQILSFVRDFGLILFVFFIGLQVGPSFFSSFKSGGLQMNYLTLLMVGSGIIITIALFFAFSDSITLAQILGVHFGAVTNTPGLGATQEALNVMGYQGENIAVAYACAYPLGVVGIIASTLILKAIFKIDTKKEEETLLAEENAEHAAPIYFHTEITNAALDGITIHEMRSMVGRSFICSRLMRNGEITSPMGHTVIRLGDVMRLVAEPKDKIAIIAFCGKENKEVDIAHDNHSPLQSATIRITKDEIHGMRVRDLHLSQLDGVNITRIYRNGMQLFPHKSMHLQLGDKVYCVGPERSIKRLADRLGNQVQKLDRPNLVAIFIGILVGVVVGSLPIAIPGMPVPLKFGLAGGPLIISILLGYYGPRMKLITYTTYSANLMLREIGISLFLASVGLSAGENFVNAIINGNGPLYIALGIVITLIPCLITGVVARLYCKMNYLLIVGMIAGSTTNPPTLAYASTLSDINAAAISYSTVYPLAMFLRILTGQVILVALWAFV